MGRQGMVNDTKDRFPIGWLGKQDHARNIQKPVGHDYGKEAAEYYEHFHTGNMQSTHKALERGQIGPGE